MRLKTFRLLAGLLLTIPISACERQGEGVVHVAVIGSEPKLIEPSARPPATVDQVLLASVAQGLVRFDARGQIEPGLAERWNVSDDGLSYIFRLGSPEWPDEGKITAHQVARILRRSIARDSRNPLTDTFGAVEEVVSMTDRVLEIRLSAPRPNLLQLLAQPEMAILRNGGGTGPFKLDKKRGEDGELLLVREVPEVDGEGTREEEVSVLATEAAAGIEAFRRQKVDLVLGGTFLDLPLARASSLPRNALQFDPVAGLFGLVPASREGPLADAEVRKLLSQAIDRDALIAALRVPNLSPRANILQPGLEGVPVVTAPDWSVVPIAERRAAQIAEADRLFGTDEKPALRIALPDGPGADLLFIRLEQDWGLLGLTLTRVKARAAADLRLIDAVAPSTSPAWFLRQFRCAATPTCVPEADELLEDARAALTGVERAALLTQAAQLMDEAHLFMPLAAPIRWSLVSTRVRGFAGNRFARHTLTGLRVPLERNATE